ncbi:hypothetical protein EV424DRAFT_1615564 [Suillus variegatus]|nr:hypothetical protein EV424DRAFT_1615564 [Suillus variegatus]
MKNKRVLRASTARVLAVAEGGTFLCCAWHGVWLSISQGWMGSLFHGRSKLIWIISSARMGICFFALGFASLIGAPICGTLLTSSYTWWVPAVFSGVATIFSRIHVDSNCLTDCFIETSAFKLMYDHWTAKLLLDLGKLEAPGESAISYTTWLPPRRYIREHWNRHGLQGEPRPDLYGRRLRLSLSRTDYDMREGYRLRGRTPATPDLSCQIAPLQRKINNKG